MVDKLKIDGGPSAITLDQDSLLKWPKMGQEEEIAVINLLRKGEISSSKEVDRLAQDFKNFIGAKYVLPKVNGTACLLSAFFTLDLKKGDEIIVPTNTYWASAMPAAFLGAKIVFCESEPNNYCIDPADIEAKITENTKAIVPVHIYGCPCEMDPIMELAQTYDLKVIEDASHAHGAEYKDRKVGTIGDCGIFSLQGSKILPAGEAGLLVTNDVEIYEKALALGHYEKISSLERDTYKKYSKTGLGLKHRLSPLHAAIARCQLKKFPEVNSRITRNTEKFRNALRNMDGAGFRIPDIPKYIKRGYFMNQMRYEEGDKIVPREDLVFLLGSEGIRVGEGRYTPLHTLPYFVEKEMNPGSMPKTEKIISQQMSFPNFPWDMDGALVDEYIAGIEKVVHHLKADLLHI